MVLAKCRAGLGETYERPKNMVELIGSQFFCEYYEKYYDILDGSCTVTL